MPVPFSILLGRDRVFQRLAGGQAHGGHPAGVAPAARLLAAGPILRPRREREKEKGETESGREGEISRPAAIRSSPRLTLSPTLVWPRLLWEKVPMLAIAGLFCLLAVHGQETATFEANQHYSFAWRVGNALVSYVFYLGKFFYPASLAALYPRISDLPPWQVAGSAALLLMITAVALAWRRQFPYLLVGWLWYLGMMVPVIGLVQLGVGNQANRFTYLPQIGLAIALAWMAAEMYRRWAATRWVCGLVAASVLAATIACAWQQAGYWRDSETLWGHTLACTPPNAFAHNCLGLALGAQGRTNEAMTHYRRAVELEPDFARAHNNLGLALANRGQINEALAHFRRAVELRPNFVQAHNNLAVLLVRRGAIGEAIDIAGRPSRTRSGQCRCAQQPGARLGEARGP